MRIAIFYNSKTNPRNIEHVQKVASLLDQSGISYLINPAKPAWNKADIALAVGGDGTVLYAANLLARTKLPVLGINFGHRGYLCGLDKNNFQDGIRMLSRKQFEIIEKTRLEARIRKPNGKTLVIEALNEISVGGINRTVTIETDIITPERNIRTRISGDGLIVSTATGSTAYNINAGGPMLLTDAFAILANNAFFDSADLLPITKSIAVPTETVIKAKDLSHNRSNLPFVIADGQKAIKAGKDDLITIRKAKTKNYFIKL